VCSYSNWEGLPIKTSQHFLYRLFPFSCIVTTPHSRGNLNQETFRFMWCWIVNWLHSWEK
jgi:hypothetical protein